MEALIMKTALARTRPDEDYLDLIREFPLRPLRTRADHALAIALYTRYASRSDLTSGQNDYFDALVHFIEDYENRTANSKLLKMSPLEALQHLMEENHLTTTDLDHIVGSRGLASELLHAKRGFSKTIVQKLAARFSVAPELFYRLGS